MSINHRNSYNQDSVDISTTQTPYRYNLDSVEMRNLLTASNQSDTHVEVNFDNENEFDESPVTIRHKPNDPLYYKKRICLYAVDPDESGKCVGCGDVIRNDFHQFMSREWDSEKCTRLEKTDAFGQLNFPGSYMKSAQYIRIENKTSTKDFIEYLCDKDSWGLDMPQLIISVTGGAQNFTIPQRMKTAFKRGLTKAAYSTGAWIITGGTNTGVMKLVGEAVADESNQLIKDRKITVIGIATWGKIALREKLVNKKDPDTGDIESNIVEYAIDDDQVNKKKVDVSLDPNHTHFILVDDGSIGKYGAEIEFRAKLEHELSLGKSLRDYENDPDAEIGQQQNRKDNDTSERIPMILIVVQGGPNTLKSVEESIKNRVPVLVIADSKGCADLIAKACTSTSQTDANLRRLVEESQMFLNSKTNKLDEKKFEEGFKQLKSIVLNAADLINIYKLDSDDSSHDIELKILRAFLNSRRTQYFENLKLALKWNRSDIAKSEILTGEEKFESNQLQVLMELAIVENKPEFVDMFLDNRVNLSSFLTKRRLYFLYNSDRVYQLDRKAPLFQLMKMFDAEYRVQKVMPIVRFSTLVHLFHSLGMTYFKLRFLPTDDTFAILEKFLYAANKRDSSLTIENSDFANKKVVEEGYDPAQNLFVWALLHNRIDIARIFWRVGQYQMCNALFAAAFLRHMANHLPDYELQLREHSDEFENLAIGVLTTFDVNTDDSVNGLILLQKVPFYEIDSLQMAVEANCKKFVAHPAVQNFLTEIWYGKIAHKPGLRSKIQFLMSCLSIGILAPAFFTVKRTKLVDKNILEKAIKPNPTQCRKKEFRSSKQSKSRYSEIINSDEDICCFKAKEPPTVTKKSGPSRHGASLRRQKSMKTSDLNPAQSYLVTYRRFMNSPRVHFFYDSVSFFIFLILFSYTMLCEFTFTVEETVYERNVSVELNYTSEPIERTVIALRKPSWIQYLLIFWVFTFFCEEIRQFFTRSFELRGIRIRFLRYARDQWNFLDLSGCLIFTIGMALRFSSFLSKNEEILTISRIVLCIDLAIWYIRLLHVSLVFRSLGPKLVMIKKMMKDLVFFVSIIAIFVCLFGVTTQATLYPGNKLNFKLLKSIINKAYWPIYGELKIIDDDLSGCKEGEECAESTGVIFSYIVLMFYMFIANVLLINLLIAMFSSTFQHVEENTDIIWKFQRYKLVIEYLYLPFLPPPFIFIAHLIDIIRMPIANACKEPQKPEDKVGTKIMLDFEKKFAEFHLRSESIKQREMVTSRLKTNGERLEILEQKLNEMMQLREKDMTQISTHLNWIMSVMLDKARESGDEIPRISKIQNKYN